MKTITKLFLISCILIFCGCGDTYQANDISIKKDTQIGHTPVNVGIEPNIEVNNNKETIAEESEKSKDNSSLSDAKSIELENENKELKKQISDLQKQINRLEEKIGDKEDVENYDTTNESEEKIYYLSDIEDIGVQGDSIYCTFLDFKNYSKDNIGEYHNNGLIFFAKNSNTDVLSKSFYNNGKYKTISGTIALAQATKDTSSTAILRIYGINSDQSITDVYTSKVFTNGITPDDFNNIDISTYECVKIEVTFNDGDPTAIGLYDSYFK